MWAFIMIFVICAHFLLIVICFVLKVLLFLHPKRFVSNLHLFEGVSFSIVYISQKFRMWFKYGLKAQKLLPRARGFCPLPFRYAPVTVGSGRVELTSET